MAVASSASGGLPELSTVFCIFQQSAHYIVLIWMTVVAGHAVIPARFRTHSVEPSSGVARRAVARYLPAVLMEATWL